MLPQVGRPCTPLHGGPSDSGGLGLGQSDSDSESDSDLPVELQVASLRPWLTRSLGMKPRHNDQHAARPLLLRQPGRARASGRRSEGRPVPSRSSR
jgi:hypothetical protein